MKIHDINHLIYNPIWTSTLLHYFLSGATESKNGKIKFELIYLGLPFLFDAEIMAKLTTSTTRSTFSKFIDSVKSNNCMFSIDNKIISFKEITNKALAIMGDNVSVSEGGYVYTMECLNYKESEDDLRDYFKAAFYLGYILAKEDYMEILLKIGATT